MVTVLDLAKLEGQSCEYYAVVKKEYGALLPPPMVTYGRTGIACLSLKLP